MRKVGREKERQRQRDTDRETEREGWALRLWTK